MWDANPRALFRWNLMMSSSLEVGDEGMLLSARTTKAWSFSKEAAYRQNWNKIGVFQGDGLMEGKRSLS